MRLLPRHFPNVIAELGGVNTAGNNMMRLEDVQLLSLKVSLAFSPLF
jgi:hypothetical protein